ncbi:MAG TPA: hypothetical protein ENK33_06995, partial [Desulfobacterales bacterium]|nr:hypothetical protein [Desulfobacterales bacterium]
MKKNPFILTAVLAGLILGACGSALASSYTIKDHTWVAAGHSRSDAMSTDGVNGTAWMDVVGDKSTYNVYGINAVRSGHKINFALYTNFSGYSHFTSGNDYYFPRLADFAIDSNQDGTFNYGVVLQNHSYWSPNPNGKSPSAPSLGVGLYSVDGWDSSAHFFEEVHKLDDTVYTAGGAEYGEYYAVGSTVHVPPVAMASGIQGKDNSLTVTQTTGSGWFNPAYIYSFSIDADT